MTRQRKPPPHNYFKARHRPGKMNQTEAAYARQLEIRQHLNEITGWWFEALKLRLADNTFYTPDFLVQAADGVLELHEVKGVWTDDARVKIKVAAALYPFRFLAIKKGRRNEGWQVEKF